MMVAILEEVETYVLHRLNTIDQYIVTRPILELCMESYQQLGEQLSQRWWEQGGLDLVSVRAAGRAEDVEV